MGSYDSPRIGSLQFRFRRGFILCVVLLFLSLLLQIAGFVTPGWIVIKFLTLESSNGLWYSRYCFNDICGTKSIDDPDIVSSTLAVAMLEFQVETTLALVCIIIAIVFTCLFGRKPRIDGTLKNITYAICTLSLISGILALIASGRVADTTVWADRVLQSQSPYKVPYSVILTGVGGIIACINAILYLAIVRPCVSDTYSSTSYLQSYPNTRDGYPGQPMYGDRQPYRSSGNERNSFYTGPSVIPDRQAYISDGHVSLEGHQNRSSGFVGPDRQSYRSNDFAPMDRDPYRSNEYIVPGRTSYRSSRFDVPDRESYRPSSDYRQTVPVHKSRSYR